MVTAFTVSGVTRRRGAACAAAPPPPPPLPSLPPPAGRDHDGVVSDGRYTAGDVVARDARVGARRAD